MDFFVELFVDDLFAARSTRFSGEDAGDDERLDEDDEPLDDDDDDRLLLDVDVLESDELESVELERERLRLLFEGDSRELFAVSVSTVISKTKH